MAPNPLGIDPTLFSLGPLEIRWYSLMYVFGFLLGGQLLKILYKEGFSKLEISKIDSYVTALIIGMFFGARFAYVFIYNWDYYSQNMGEILSVWKGGLSFHGAVVGMCLATYYFARKNKLHFFQISDSMAVAGSPGLFLGRMGNFINGELYGRVTDSPFGIIFPDGGPYPRHPSQLYEGFSEGLLLFFILYYMSKKVSRYGIVSTAFLLGYGFFRFVVEFFRQPDAQLGYYFNGLLTMGQILCLVMMLLAIGMWFWSKKINLPIKRAKLT